MYTTFTQEQWDALLEAYPIGTVVQGTVLHVAQFGVFVQLDELPTVKALLEIIHFPRAEQQHAGPIQPEDYPPVGARIEARILDWSLAPGEVRLTQLSHLHWTTHNK